VGPAVDVYALAAVAYEALSGQAPWKGSSPLEIAHGMAKEPTPDVRRAWPSAPAEVAEALAAGMATDPERRPATAGELVDRLEGGGERTTQALAAAGAPTEAASAPSRQRRSPLLWLGAIAGAVVLLALAGLVAIIAGGGDAGSERAPAAGGEAGGEAATGALGPGQTVVAFYQRSAAGD
jgi:hypothetical protein